MECQAIHIGDPSRRSRTEQPFLNQKNRELLLQFLLRASGRKPQGVMGFLGDLKITHCHFEHPT